MGELEKAVRVEIRRTKINKAIIGTVAAAGLLAVVTMAPNAPGAFARLGLVASAQKNQALKRSFSRLVQRGYIEVKDGKAKLTPKGEKFAALLGEGRLAPKKTKRWDNKWRVLIFDIPEKRKLTRNKVRATLVGLGFVRLQDSVWVYPYDCEDLITLFKVDMKIGKDLLYIIADRIEYDVRLRTHFGLG
jgi:DNA-binding transcriptional regulator PaaX